MVDFTRVDMKKIKEGRHYRFDEKNKLIIYDPLENHVGERDYTIHDTVANMIEIAKKEKDYEIQATFNGGVFKINKDTTLDEGVQLARTALLEYEKKQEPIRLKEAAEKAERIQQQNKLDEALIENEQLDCINAPSFTAQYSEKGIKFAEHWGRLMQAEMKKQGISSLTEELVDSTEQRTSDYFKDNEEGYYAGRSLLIGIWKHGEQLGEILELPKKEVLQHRKKALLLSKKDETLLKQQNKQETPDKKKSTVADIYLKIKNMFVR